MSEATFSTDEQRSPKEISRDARAVRTWLRLARVAVRASRVLETQVRQHGLSLGQFDVLTHVARQEGQTQQELANGLLVTKGNISHLVDRLEGAGLVKRHAGHGRVLHLFTTPAGRELLAAIVPPHEALITDMFHSVDDQELVTLHRILRALDISQEG